MRDLDVIVDAELSRQEQFEKMTPLTDELYYEAWLALNGFGIWTPKGMKWHTWPERIAKYIQENKP